MKTPRKPDRSLAVGDQADPKSRLARRVPKTVGWYMVIPAIVLYAFAVIIPASRGFLYSLTDWNGRNPTINFVGLDNFVRILQDSGTLDATMRTIGFALAATVFQTGVGLGLALAVTSRIKGQNLFRVIFFAPVVILSVVTAFLWRYILAPDGALNKAFEGLGLTDLVFPWLGAPASAVFWIVVVVVWQHSGISMAIFIAGLESVSRDVLEASELDGATGFKQLRYIKWPLITPAITVVMLLSLIGGLRLFDQIWILTNGGPAGGTETLSIRMYRETFLYGEYSSGVTMAVILAILVSVFAFLQYWWLNRRGAQ